MFRLFFAVFGAVFFAHAAFAAAYDNCSSSVRYDSCKAGYYMTYSGAYNGTPRAGNRCTVCPPGYTCAGGTANAVRNAITCKKPVAYVDNYGYPQHRFDDEICYSTSCAACQLCANSNQVYAPNGQCYYVSGVFNPYGFNTGNEYDNAWVITDDYVYYNNAEWYAYQVVSWARESSNYNSPSWIFSSYTGAYDIPNCRNCGDASGWDFQGYGYHNMMDTYNGNGPQMNSCEDGYYKGDYMSSAYFENYSCGYSSISDAVSCADPGYCDKCPAPFNNGGNVQGSSADANKGECYFNCGNGQFANAARSGCENVGVGKYKNGTSYHYQSGYNSGTVSSCTGLPANAYWNGPANATTSAAACVWTCNSGYEKKDNQCVRIECDLPYVQANGSYGFNSFIPPSGNCTSNYLCPRGSNQVMDYNGNCHSVIGVFNEYGLVNSYGSTNKWIVEYASTRVDHYGNDLHGTVYGTKVIDNYHECMSTSCNLSSDPMWGFITLSKYDYPNELPDMFSTGNYPYIQCDTGYYVPYPNAGLYTDGGSYSNFAESMNDSCGGNCSCTACANAPANAHYIPDSGSGTCQWECDSGYIRNGNTCALPVQSCGAGTYWNGSACTTCPAGSYCPGFTDVTTPAANYGLEACPPGLDNGGSVSTWCGSGSSGCTTIKNCYHTIVPHSGTNCSGVRNCYWTSGSGSSAVYSGNDISGCDGDIVQSCNAGYYATSDTDFEGACVGADYYSAAGSANRTACAAGTKSSGCGTGADAPADCAQYKTLKTGLGRSAIIRATGVAPTTPALHVRINDTIYYGTLIESNAAGVKLHINGTTYTLVD